MSNPTQFEVCMGSQLQGHAFYARENFQCGRYEIGSVKLMIISRANYPPLKILLNID